MGEYTLVNVASRVCCKQDLRYLGLLILDNSHSGFLAWLSE